MFTIADFIVAVTVFTNVVTAEVLNTFMGSDITGEVSEGRAVIIGVTTTEVLPSSMAAHWEGLRAVAISWQASTAYSTILAITPEAVFMARHVTCFIIARAVRAVAVASHVFDATIVTITNEASLTVIICFTSTEMVVSIVATDWEVYGAVLIAIQASTSWLTILAITVEAVFMTRYITHCIEALTVGAVAVTSLVLHFNAPAAVITCVAIGAIFVLCALWGALAVDAGLPRETVTLWSYVCAVSCVICWPDTDWTKGKLLCLIKAECPLHDVGLALPTAATVIDVFLITCTTIGTLK
jgi:hypothetical protein